MSRTHATQSGRFKIDTPTTKSPKESRSRKDDTKTVLIALHYMSTKLVTPIQHVKLSTWATNRVCTDEHNVPRGHTTPQSEPPHHKSWDKQSMSGRLDARKQLPSILIISSYHEDKNVHTNSWSWDSDQSQIRWKNPSLSSESPGTSAGSEMKRLPSVIRSFTTSLSYYLPTIRCQTCHCLQICIQTTSWSKHLNTQNTLVEKVGRTYTITLSKKVSNTWRPSRYVTRSISWHIT
jgi:hypothetical protein